MERYFWPSASSFFHLECGCDALNSSGPLVTMRWLEQNGEAWIFDGILESLLQPWTPYLQASYYGW